MSMNTLMGGSQASFRGTQLHGKRQWTEAGTQEVPPEHQEACLYCGGDRALAQAAQAGCGVSSLEIFKSHLDMDLGTLLWVALLGQGLDQVGSRGPCQPQLF